MPHRPILHRRDHEYGGADPVGIVWEIIPPATGVNDFTFDVTSTYTAGGFPILGTFTEGTTPGYWSTTDGAGTFCHFAGDWEAVLAGTVTHTSTTSQTVVKLLIPGGGFDVIFNVVMANTDTQPLSFTGTYTFALLDDLRLVLTHAVGGTPSSTLTGTMTLTKVG